MKKEQIIKTLRNHERDIRARGAKSIYLFGSFLHGEARRDSDIDLFIDYYRNRNFSLIELVELEGYLKKLLRKNVDLFTRSSLHDLIREEVEESAERIF